MTIEGIDFSEGNPPSVATLKDRGIKFVGRYAVNDKSPHGRGNTGPEYHNYLANGIDTFLYWEGAARWMVGGMDPDTGQDAGPGGWEAGVAAAQNAQQNIIECGEPPTIPVHFAHDIDPQPQHFAQIDQCLSGAASVIGWDRVGGYGGWLLIDYLAQGGNVKYLVQTIAWEYGRGVHPAATLYQYRTDNVDFDGTPCDLVRALVPNYGQASMFIAKPHPDPVPAPKPKPPTTVPGIKLPKGVTVELLGRLYTGSPGNHITIGGETISFAVDGPVSRAWLKRCLGTIPKGKTWREGTWPQIKDRVRRGPDGKDGTDYIFVDGGVIHADANGRVAQ